MSEEFPAFSDVVAERGEAVRTLCMAIDSTRDPSAKRIMKRMAEQIIQTICIDDAPKKTIEDNIRELRK